MQQRKRSFGIVVDGKSCRQRIPLAVGNSTRDVCVALHFNSVALMAS
jgi:hypothetical protein